MAHPPRQTRSTKDISNLEDTYSVLVAKTQEECSNKYNMLRSFLVISVLSFALTESTPTESFMTVSDTMDIPDDFTLVSSLYGPGNWGCWFLTIISLLCTWTFNIESRQKDTITNDFLAALAIPCIAAGHLIWLIHFTDSIRLIDYVDYSTSAIRVSHPTIVKHLLAAEGPLRICRTFTVLQMALAILSASKGHVKRMNYTLMAGGLNIAAQESVQWWSNMETAPPFEERPLVFRPHSRWLSLNLSIFYIALAVAFFSRPTLDKMKGDPSCEGPHLNSAENADCQQSLKENDYENDHIQQPLEDYEAQLESKALCYPCLSMRLDVVELNWMILSFIPLSTELKTNDDEGFGLIPSSSISITELDQVVALMVGLITLGCTLRDIIGANRREMQSRKKTRIREETGLGEERLLYLNTIVTGWTENQRELQGQLRSDQACNVKLDRLKSQNEIFIKIMAREKLFEKGSMEHEWLRRKFNKKVVEDALKLIPQPRKVYVPSHRASRDNISSIRARIK